MVMAMAKLSPFVFIQCWWQPSLGLPTSSSSATNVTLINHIHSGERDTASDKKVQILIVFLFLAVLGGFALTAINVNHDFLQLTVFYRGFLGRKLLIQEGGLVRKRCELVQRPTSLHFHQDSNGCNTSVVYLPLQRILKMVESEREEMEEEERLLWPDKQQDQHLYHHQHQAHHHYQHRQQQQQPISCGLLPTQQRQWANPNCNRKLEEEDPEWRDLNYDLEVGTLPPCLGEFYLQYDWGCYSKEMTDIEIAHRKALLAQFRKWKARNMRKFKIVVTERGRREMAEVEEEKNKKRDKKASS